MQERRASSALEERQLTQSGLSNRPKCGSPLGPSPLTKSASSIAYSLRLASSKIWFCISQKVSQQSSATDLPEGWPLIIGRIMPFPPSAGSERKSRSRATRLAWFKLSSWKLTTRSCDLGQLARHLERCVWYKPRINPRGGVCSTASNGLELGTSRRRGAGMSCRGLRLFERASAVRARVANLFRSTGPFASRAGPTHEAVRPIRDR